MTVSFNDGNWLLQIIDDDMWGTCISTYMHARIHAHTHTHTHTRTRTHTQLIHPCICSPHTRSHTQKNVHKADTSATWMYKNRGKSTHIIQGQSKVNVSNEILKDFKHCEQTFFNIHRKQIHMSSIWIKSTFSDDGSRWKENYLLNTTIRAVVFWSILHIVLTTHLNMQMLHTLSVAFSYVPLHRHTWTWRHHRLDSAT